MIQSAPLIITGAKDVLRTTLRAAAQAGRAAGVKTDTWIGVNLFEQRRVRVNLS
jgi:hypothetical protein